MSCSDRRWSVSRVVSSSSEAAETVSPHSLHSITRMPEVLPQRGWSASAERAIEIERRADEREVGERLREVAELLAARADLLRVQPEVVGVREHLLERQPRLLEPPGARERLDVPERAHRE